MRIISCLFFLLTFLTSCDEEVSDACQNAPDVPALNNQFELKRFDQALFALDTNQLASKLEQLHLQYPDFYPSYMNQIMRFASRFDDYVNLSKEVQDFISHKDMRFLHDSVQDVFTDMQMVNEQFNNAFARYKYYFPHKPLPEVVGFVGGLQYAAVTVDSLLIGVGLDMYLTGMSNYTPIFPQYLQHRFSADFVVPQALTCFYAPSMQPQYKAKDDLVYQMIEAGKMVYFLELLMPCASEHLWLGYTPEQTEWCMASEHSIWEYLNEKEILFKDDIEVLRRYLNESPTTVGMPKESPGKIGQFIGWRIVQSYMRKNKVSPQEMITAIPPSEILQRSGYKPKKP